MSKYINLGVAMVLVTRAKIVLEQWPECSTDLILITGFHGIGYVGFIATRYMVSALKAQRIGYVRIFTEPLYTSTSNQGGLYVPYELYNYRNIVFFCPNFGFTSRYDLQVLDLLVTWVCTLPFRCAILFGGLDNRLRSGEEKLRLAATSKFLRKFRDWVRAPLLDEGYFIVGPLARLLTRFEELDFPAVAVLPYADYTRPDPYAASVGISYVSELLNLGVDLSKLIETAKAIEKEIEEMRKRAERLTAEKMTYI